MLLDRSYICLPQFDIGLGIYCIHYALRLFYPPYQGTFARGFIGDLVCLMVVIPFMANASLILGVRKRLYITMKEVIAYWLLFSIVFEYISPQYLNRGQGTFVDVVAYFLGGLILYFSQPFIICKIKSNIIKWR